MTEVAPQIEGSNLAGPTAPHPTITPYVNGSLYVGDLPAEIHEGNLLEFFSKIGPVASVRVCRDSLTRQSLGYGYVNFHSYQDAERALTAVNYKDILPNQPIRIMWCQRDPSQRRSFESNIFIRNLGKNVKPGDLADKFSGFGSILSCKIPRDTKGIPKGYGFVHFENLSDAQKAITEGNGKAIFGADALEIAPYLPPAQRPRSEAASSNLYFKHFDPKVTEEQLRAELSKFGTITSLVIPRKPDGTPRGFAFCNFSKPEEAAEAVKSGVSLEEKQLYVSRFQARASRDRELRERIHQNPNGTARPNSNVYVKNLDESVTKETLEGTFGQYGAVTSAKIATDENGRSRGFGFVNFQTPDDATKAIAEMNGRFLNHKNIYAAPFQPKTIRQAQLNAQWAQRMYMQQQQQMMMPPPMFAAPTQMFYGGRPNFYNVAPRPYQQRPQAQPYMGQPMPMQQMQMPIQMQMQQGQRPRQMNPQQMQSMPPTNKPTQMPRMAGQPGTVKQPYANRVKYGSNVQNIQPRPASGLTAAQLAAASPSEQKNMLGERLYALISPYQGDRAGKITGMLLEMDNSELLILLEDPQQLALKVQEANSVLDAHSNA